MVRSALIVAALLVARAAVAQTVMFQDVPVPQGGVVTGAISGAGVPPRDTRPVTGSSVIRGRVIDASTGMPLRKAVVNIFSAEIRESRSTSTDADGRYQFADLPAGQFNISVNRAGYINVSYGQSSPNDVGKPLRVGEKQVIEKIDFTVPRGAVITGRVLDEYGEPMPDVQVSALRNQFTANGPRPMNAGRGAMTDDIGQFRLFGLSPGQYVLSATYRQMMVRDTSDDASGYAPTYYPGTANLADAQKLAVGLGGTVSDVTLMLVPTKTARVSGIVVDSQGRPVRQGSVMMMARNANMAMTSGGGPIRPDGTFTIGGVAPGEYVVRAMTPSQPGAPPETATAAVSVNGTDLTDVRVEPTRPITVSGRIVLDPATARTFQPQTVRVSVSPIDFGPMFGPPLPPVAVRDDLTFEVKASPGPSLIRATVAAPGVTWMIKSVTLNGSDITDGMTFKNDDVAGVEIELTNKVPDISGLVTDARGNSVLDYSAIAFPQEQERWATPGLGRTAMVRPDEQGRFRFRTLRPGNYYLVAIDHIQQGDWMDPAFMEAVHSRATRITVNEGDVQTLDLKLVQMR